MKFLTLRLNKLNYEISICFNIYKSKPNFRINDHLKIFIKLLGRTHNKEIEMGYIKDVAKKRIVICFLQNKKTFYVC